MSLNLGIMSAAVTLDDKDYRSTLAGLESSSQSSFKKIAQSAAAYLTLGAIAKFGQTAIRTFSDLEEETNKFSVVFAGLGSETSRILKQMRDDFGLSELAAKRMLAGTGDMLTGFGFDKDVALALSEGAAKLGADIASFSNYAGGAEGATSALTKAMLGEAESAKLLGVVIRQDSDEYKDLVKQAMTTGITIDALGKTFKVQSEQQAKAVAALALAYQQSPNAIGDFVRSKESLANQTRILQNNFEQLTATIGGDLAPAYTDALNAANKLLKSYNDLSPATRSMINDVLALSAAMALLGKTGAIAKANMLVTGGLTAAKAGLAGIATAANSAAAAIGPVGAALIAVGAVVAIGKAMYADFNNELKTNAEIANSRVDAANQLSIAHQQEASATNFAMQRLQDLSKHERLSNAEKEESEKLIKQITDIHKDLDIALDKTTGKLKIGASAWAQMNEEQQKTARKDVSKQLNALEARNASLMNRLHADTDSFWRNNWLNQLSVTIAQSISDDKDFGILDKERFSEVQNMIQSARELKTLEEQIAAFQNIANKLRNEGDIKEAKQADEIVAQLKKQLELKKQLDAMNNGKPAKNAKAEAEALKKSAEESDKIRKAIEALQNKEFSIKLNAADANEKLSLLKEKTNEIFDKEVSGKYKSIEDFIGADRTNMTLEELKTVEKLVELRSQQTQIEKDLTKNITAERQEYEKYIAQRSKNERSRNFDKQVSALTKSGDKENAIRLVESELSKAKIAAKKLRKQYTASLEAAEKDASKDTEFEKKRRAKLKEQMQLALSDEDKLKGKLETLKTSETQTQKTVGSFSLAALQSMLGASKPEQQTAKNTKKTVELLGKMNEQLGNGSIKYNE